MKFAEASQSLPVITKSYGKKRIAAFADDTDPEDAQDDQDVLADVDLATLDEATVASLYEELQAPDLLDNGLDFVKGQ